ncbi:MAG: HAD-IC family P-type ATPase, partial [Pseudomonadota bacterium]
AADGDSRVARIAGTLNSTRAARPAGARLAERVAARFVLALLVIAAAVGLTWWVVDPARALGIVLAVLVVTCPCALSLAIPTAQSAAATRLARRGLLVHRPEVLDALTGLTTVLFDKTGTLTRGEHTIEAVRGNPAHPHPLSPDELLEHVARVERYSTHPLARAFDGIAVRGDADNVEQVPGRGICGRVAGRDLRIGNARFVRALADAWITRDASFLVGDQDGLLGAIVLSDQWRGDARATVKRLHDAGLVTRIVSGDRRDPVARAVLELGLDRGDAECLPEDKLSVLRGLQREGQRVLAVGDGVNDAALLAGADVSVAVAGGAELAQSGADIVLTGTELGPIAELPGHAAALRRTIGQNLGWAVGYNLLAVPLAAAGLIGPGLAALGMSLSSLLVVLNSSRLAWRRTNPGHQRITRVAHRTAMQNETPPTTRTHQRDAA